MNKTVAIFFGLMLSVQVAGQGNFFWSHGGEAPKISEYTYGYMYNWFVVDEAQISGSKGLISGMHVPSRSEFETLVNYVSDNADDLKSTREAPNDDHPRWDNGLAGVDTYNYTAFPDGRRNIDGDFTFLGNTSSTWSTTEDSNNPGLYWYLYITDEIQIYNLDDNHGMSLRLVRSTTSTEDSNYSDGDVIEVVTDYDGNEYDVIKIGDQAWTRQNLSTKHYADGTLIPYIADDTDWENATSGARCAYDNDESYVFN